jgi:hypothetical protein
MNTIVGLIFRVIGAVLLAPFRVLTGINNWHAYHYVSSEMVRDIKGKWDNS